jgi:1-acyl-sn-glycerol-3-phosphate acyltransferase
MATLPGFSCIAETVDQLQTHFRNADGRLIILMSHSSHWDAMFGYLLFRKTDIPVTVFLAMWPMLAPLWRRMGYIPKIQNAKKAGNVSQIVNDLNRRRSFALLIAPERPDGFGIRSGYYHIAKQTRSKLCVVGFDYYQMKGVCSSKMWDVCETDNYQQFVERHESEMMSVLRSIHPMHADKVPGFDQRAYMIEHCQDRQAIRPFCVYSHLFRHYTVEIVVAMFSAAILLFVMIVKIMRRPGR